MAKSDRNITATMFLRQMGHGIFDYTMDVKTSVTISIGFDAHNFFKYKIERVVFFIVL